MNEFLDQIIVILLGVAMKANCLYSMTQYYLVPTYWYTIMGQF